VSGLPASGKDRWIERQLERIDRSEVEKLREELRASPAASVPDLAGAFDLLDALLRLGRKVEQERW
jgi:predicted kinase